MPRINSSRSAAEPVAPELFAVIHIGSSAITMLLGERQGGDAIRTIERLSQPVPLAADVFRAWNISQESIERAVEILRDCAEVMREAGLTGPPQRIVAANVLLEARNHDTLLNRIDVALGWQAKMLEDGEMTRLIYFGTRRLVHRNRRMAEKNTLVCHIGPGNTRALFFDESDRLDYHSYRLGVERVRAQLEQVRGPLSISALMIGQHTRSVLDQFALEFDTAKVRQLVALGHEIQAVAPLIGTVRKDSIVVPVKRLTAMAREVESLGAAHLVNRHQLDFRTADLLLYTLSLHAGIAEDFDLKEIVVPASDYEETLLTGLMSPKTAVENFGPEVLQTSVNLGRRFQIDLAHAQHVAMLAGRLFDELHDLHGLGAHEALLLQVAALLHETGHLISARDHHRHSQYIIQHNEVFGLSEDDTLAAALIARYHRGEVPSTEHAEYRNLDRDQRLTVAKLVALLRVADALDRGRGQRVSLERAVVDGPILRLHLGRTRDLGAEEVSMREKSALFTQVYGLEVALHVAPAKTSA